MSRVFVVSQIEVQLISQELRDPQTNGIRLSHRPQAANQDVVSIDLEARVPEVPVDRSIPSFQTGGGFTLQNTPEVTCRCFGASITR